MNPKGEASGVDVWCSFDKIIDITELIPNPKNPNQHGEKQVAMLAKIIRHQGWRNPIVISKRSGFIIKGHGRLQAAKLLQVEFVPVDYQDYKNEADEYADLIADNRIAELAETNIEIMKVVLEDLECNLGLLDIELTGFNQEEAAEIMGIEAQADAFENEEITDELLNNLQKKWKSKKGDLWSLGGGHRILCGDSTDEDSIEILFNNNKPILMITDPPYGVNYDASWRDGYDLGVGKRSRGKVHNDDNPSWMNVYKLCDPQVAYIWHASRFTHVIASDLEECGFDLISCIIWGKQHFALSRGDYHWQHEPCWYAVKKGQNHNWQGARDQSTLWEIKNNNSFGNQDKEETWGHSTQKPLECMARPIRNNTSKGQIVCDPFLGSGTTLIAAHDLGRICYGCELDEKYMSVILERFEKHTGIKPEKIS